MNPLMVTPETTVPSLSPTEISGLLPSDSVPTSRVSVPATTLPVGNRSGPTTGTLDPRNSSGRSMTSERSNRYTPGATLTTTEPAIPFAADRASTRLLNGKRSEPSPPAGASSSTLMTGEVDAALTEATGA